MPDESKTTFEGDPFKDIPPALLNSADIQAYQHECELLRGEPFDKERLKSASYEICCKGDVYWSDPSNQLRRQRIEEGQHFVLLKNQIAFLFPDVVFHLPDYLAARFNLTISLVHKGLLLGTGPMVDPGFQGRLLVPVHNLTSENVVLSASEGFIWIEFTKLSSYPAKTLTGTPAHAFVFAPFPTPKKNRSVDKYFSESGGVPRRSSLQETLELATNAADGAKEAQAAASKQEERWKRRIALGTSLGLVTAAVAIAALLFTTYLFWAQSVSIVRDAQQWATDSKKDRSKEIRELDSRVEALEKRLELNSKIAPSSRQEPAKGVGRKQ